MVNPSTWQEWSAAQARAWIAVPGPADDKYSRGVLGICTGSPEYPGAAVLGVQAAARTGVGMIRYVGPAAAAQLVLARRPEVVVGPGRVQAWLLGSGMNGDALDAEAAATLLSAAASGVPVVCDAGALDYARRSTGPTVITPHFRELASLLARAGTSVTPATIARAPGEWAGRAAELLGVTVLLKGSVTYIAHPAGARFTVSDSPSWLATAGAGDVLGGILGALLATHSDRLQTDAAALHAGDALPALAAVAATAAWLHAEAARRASAGGPIVALDVADAVPATIAALLSGAGGPC
ncbi:NAD(P)H-hydrate dehydratase [Cryobacterium melibiosiphilum]|uniref:ADP-dependent (S)-NAD(P)H-hydrate dehydratase n=1 Tax=Cryobacterium melibiosiphilum TaxID=995039 RepID=A0A3A5MFA2_9MICO|nr:ADP/ATP-dependent (S)-NAD(P)H-hydrate dehydratase [Cryobacterium melibiosiphilum]RJT87471.1 NAD(P)H-hydrate dehydratase [Cryobacterium melibiosiphilum]